MPALEPRTKLEKLLTDEAYQRAWRYAARLSNTREDAEDLLQDALASAVRHVGSLRDEARFTGWFLSIIRRRFIDRGRRNNARLQTDELPEQLAAPGGDDPLALLISAALAKLPPAQQEILGLFYLDSLNLQETGEVLGLPARAVRQRLYRARQALRRLLEQDASLSCIGAVNECVSGGKRYGS